MERMVLRSVCRAACRRYRGSPSAFSSAVCAHRTQLASRSLFTVSSPSATNSFRNSPSDGRSSIAAQIGGVRYFSEDVSHMPPIQDSDIQKVFKDLMASSWDELPHTVVHDAKKAVSKNTDDKAGQETLKNVFRAAEASEEFSGILVSLKMEIDDSIGLSGENVKPLPKGIADALRLVFERYSNYLEAFGPDESYLRKKVETELGTKMIHLKMRCSGLGSEWGKVGVLGTSGLSGSYVEQRSS